MSDIELAEQVAELTLDLVRPLQRAVESEGAFGAFLMAHGWRPPDALTYVTEFRDLIAIADSIDALAAALDSMIGSGDVDAIASVLSKAGALIDKVSNLVEFATNPPTQLAAPLDGAAFWSEFPVDLLGSLIVDYLNVRYPAAFAVLCLVGIIDHTEVTFDPGTQPDRVSFVRKTVHWARVPQLVTAPGELARTVYGWGGSFAHDELLTSFHRAMVAFGSPAAVLPASPALVKSYYLDHGRTPPMHLRELRAPLFVDTGGPQGYAEVGLLLLPIPPSTGAVGTPVGFLAAPYIRAQLSGVFSLASSVTVELTGSLATDAAAGVEFRPSGLTPRLSPSTSSIDLGARVRYSPRGVAGGPAMLVGPPDGTRLEIGRFTVAGDVDLGVDRPPDVGVLVEFGQAALAVAARDGDGFLARILPPGGFHVDFDLAVGWSTRRGLYLRGAAQLDVHIPVHTTFLGVLTLETVDLSIGLRSDPAPGVTAVAAATATVQLGPVTASVEQMGLELLVTFPEGGGNAGPANLELGFHPPVGAGLAISAAVVSGGGYLRADYSNGRYGGVLQLQIAGVVNATAIGSLVVSPNPAHPDAPRNFSLLLILVAEFPPIQLGFGFTLNGLGGILGGNRTINVEALRAGVRTRALDSILFPEDAAANAVRILRDVEAVFPPAPGQFVIGLMARFGWGSPRLITIDVGIIIELPSPLRIVLLGRLSLALPEPDAAVVELHLDVLGILDLTNKNISIDATLYDSRVAAFTISGDMAARLNYGAEPGLAVSAGGFNPRFTPPPGFPKLRRLAISLGEGDNPRIRLDAYLANTANSIQIGARLEVYVEADLGVLGVFSATAYLGFDALITLEPFSFVVDLAGGVEIRRNGAVLFGAELRLSLSGPQPVRAWGYAQFDFLGRHRIPFDHTFGPDPLELALTLVDPVGALLAALADPRNWQTQLPSMGAPTVSLRELPPPPDGTVLADPLGSIGVRQRIVPLDVPIDRFAGAPLPEARTLRVSVSLGGTAAAGTPVRDAFPTGESLELTDDEKLSREQFSQWPGGLTGIRLAGTLVNAGTAVTGVDGYETRLVDPVGRTRRPGVAGYTSADGLLAGFLARGAAATGPLHRSGVAAHVGRALGVAARPARYRVLGQTDLTVVDVDGTGRTEYQSESEALAARDRSGDRANLLVAGAHEGAAR
jgi:hypothetical protein